MRSSRRLTLVAALSAVAFIAGTGVAQADHWRRGELRHDVTGYRYDPAPEPCGTLTDVDATADTTIDITSIGVGHMKDSVVVVAHFVDLKRWGDHETEFAIRTNGRDYTVDVSRYKTGGTVEVELFRSTPPPEPTGECGSVVIAKSALSCPRLTGEIAPRGDLVSVRVPRRCVSYPRWVRGGARSHRWVGDAVHADTWAPAGTDASGIIGPFGPRVRRN
jgi:hypothetical protein